MNIEEIFATVVDPNMPCDIEEWRDIAGFEGCYQVSNYGKVKSLTRVITIRLPNGTIYTRLSRGRVLRQKKDKDGYLMVGLGKSATRKVHRLVAEAFIPNLNQSPVINHKDENKANNFVGNLEWCTIEYNNNYGTCRDKSAKAHRKAVLQLDRLERVISWYGSLIEAEQVLGINGASTMISRCCKGKIKQAYGYKWKYDKD